MKLHPRHFIVSAAKIDIDKSVCDAVGRHDLTHAELTSILADLVASWNRYAIRAEREENEK
jgi:hypothetical protein